MPRTRIAIVGAGVAGLLAARELRRRGRDVVIYEARPRPGGRVRTLRPRGVPLPVELGAEFVHGDAPVTRRLLAEAGASLRDVAGENVELRRGRAHAVGFWRGIDHVFENVDRRRSDESFAEFLAGQSKLPSEERRLARAFVQGFHAADLERVSVQSIAPHDGEPLSASTRRAARVSEGYDRLVRFLARDLAGALRLGHTVQRIAWRRGAAELAVEHRGDRFTQTARAVIVTLPVGVLASSRGRGALRLDPEPLRARLAIERLAMGNALRVSIALRRWPWSGDSRRAERLRRAAYLHTPGRPFNVWLTAYPEEWPLLVGWSGGPPAQLLSAQPARRLTASALAELTRAAGTRRDALDKLVIGAWCHDWNRDPFSRGAYSYALVGGDEASRELARPVEGTLFFAGEATAAGGDNGTVEGALASAERAVEQVERALS